MASRSVRRTGVVLAVAAGALTACSGSSTAPSRPTSTTSTGPTPSATASLPTGVEVDSFDAPGSLTLPGAVTSAAAYWTGALSGSQPTTVFARDLVHHRTVTVATARSGWTTSWVRASGDRVVYVEEKESSDASGDAVAWRIHAVDRTMGSNQVLADSIGAARGLAPSPEIEGSTVVWVQAARRGADVRVAVLSATPAVRTVLSQQSVVMATVSAARIVLLRQLAGARRDLFALPVQGGPERRLTALGDVRFVTSHDGWAAYERGPLDGDPTAQGAVPVDGSRDPITVTGAPPDGATPASNIAPGRGLLAWFASEGTMVAATGGVPTLLTDHPDIQLRLAWDGQLLLWGDTTLAAGVFHNRLHVSRFG